MAAGTGDDAAEERRLVERIAEVIVEHRVLHADVGHDALDCIECIVGSRHRRIGHRHGQRKRRGQAGQRRHAQVIGVPAEVEHLVVGANSLEPARAPGGIGVRRTADGEPDAMRDDRLARHLDGSRNVR